MLCVVGVRGRELGSLFGEAVATVRRGGIAVVEVHRLVVLTEIGLEGDRNWGGWGAELDLDVVVGC